MLTKFNDKMHEKRTSFTNEPTSISVLLKFELNTLQVFFLLCSLFYKKKVL